MKLRTFSRRKVGIAAVALALLSAAVVVGTGLATASSRRPGVRIRPHAVSLPKSVARQAARNEAALARRFPMFRKARATSADAHPLPSVFMDRLLAQAANPVPAGALAEPDPYLAVYLGTASSPSLDTINIWAMPGANDLCMAEVPAKSIHGGGSVTCESDENAAAGQLVSVNERPTGGATIIGLVPGAASQVVVHQQDGNTLHVPVTNGLWTVGNDSQAASATVAGASGTIVLPPIRH